MSGLVITDEIAAAMGDVIKATDALWAPQVERLMRRRLRMRARSLSAAATKHRANSPRVRLMAALEWRLDVAYELGRASVLARLPAEQRSALEGEDRAVGLEGAAAVVHEMVMSPRARFSERVGGV